MRHFIGIDIGATTTKIGLVDGRGVVLGKAKVDSSIITHEDHFIDHINGLILSLIRDKVDLQDIEGIGIGAPTGNYLTGRIENPVNLNLSKPLEIVRLFESMIRVPVYLTNDANIAALGELEFGVGQEWGDFMVVTLGTGIGSGIVSNGQIIHGIDDLAGEIGHFILIPEGRLCSCGRRGCLEAYVSIRGLSETYSELNQGSAELSPVEIFNEAGLFNFAAQKAIEKRGITWGTPYPT